MPPLPDMEPLASNPYNPQGSPSCFFGADTASFTDEETNAWQDFLHGTLSPLPTFDSAYFDACDLDADHLLGVDMSDLPNPADFGLDFDSVLPGIGESGWVDGALTGPEDSSVLPAGGESTGGSIGIPGDGAIEVVDLGNTSINQPRSPVDSFPEQVSTEIGASAIHPPSDSSGMPDGSSEPPSETGAEMRAPTNNPTNNPGNTTEPPQATPPYTTEPDPQSPTPAKRPVPPPESEQEEEDEPPMKKQKQIRRKKDDPEPDYSAIIRQQVMSSSRTGQACDRCKVKRMKCDSKQGSCVNCRFWGHKCKTTDLTTGVTTTRGEITQLKEDLKLFEDEILKLEEENDTLQDELESLRAILNQRGFNYNGHQGYQVGTVRSCGCLCPLHDFPPSSSRLRRRQLRAQQRQRAHPPQHQHQHQHQHQRPPQPIHYSHPQPHPFLCPQSHSHPQKQAEPTQSLTNMGYGHNPTFLPQNHQNYPAPPPAPSIPVPHVPFPHPAQGPIHIPAPAIPNLTTKSNPTNHRLRPPPHYQNNPNRRPSLPNQPNSNPNSIPLSRSFQRYAYAPPVSNNVGSVQQQQRRPRQKVRQKQQSRPRQQADYIPTDDGLYWAQTAQMALGVGASGNDRRTVECPVTGMGQNLELEIPRGTHLGV